MNEESRLRDARMSIRGFPDETSDKPIQDAWNLLRVALQEILCTNTVAASFEELYRHAYTLVLHKHGELLYNSLRGVITEHLTGKVLAEVLAALQDSFLQVLLSAWHNYFTAIRIIRDICAYMDRVYVRQNNLNDTKKMGLVLFCDHVIKCEAVQVELKKTLLAMVVSERKGELIDRTALKNACAMLVELGFGCTDFYEEMFEKSFLEQSREFYCQEAHRLLAENSASVYIHEAEQRRSKEEEFMTQCFHESTRSKTMSILQDELVRSQMTAIMEMPTSGMGHMLKNNQFDDLLCMYRLFRSADNGNQLMIETLSSQLRQFGGEIVMEREEPTNPVTRVSDLLDLKERFDQFLEKSFLQDKQFKEMIDSDFEYVLNLSPKMAEYLSLFIDDTLKKSGLESSEQEVETLLNRTMVLVEFLQDKNSFQQYYKQHLSQRLSCDVETMMISKLKPVCGSKFASELAEMLIVLAPDEQTPAM